LRERIWPDSQRAVPAAPARCVRGRHRPGGRLCRRVEGAPAAAPTSRAATEAAPLPSGSSDTDGSTDGGLAGAEPAGGPVTPGQFTLQFQALLGQHTMLAADMMRGRIRNDPDVAQAANAAIGKNTDALGKLFAAELGADAPDVHAALVRARDRAVQLRPRARRRRRDRDGTGQAAGDPDRGQAGRLLRRHSHGQLGKQQALDGVADHINHLLDQADQYAARTTRSPTPPTARVRARVQRRQGARDRAAHAHPGEGDRDPSWRLRSALTQLLGEHVELVVGALRAGATDAPDFKAAADAVNGNTTALAGAVGVLFTPAAGHSFEQLWADHIDLLVAYSAALAKGDDAAKAQITRA
jgi:hypothetical protein